MALVAEEDLGLELERAAARARTSTSVVIRQLAASSVPEAEWVEYFTERGNAYYYNEKTGESRWELPSSSEFSLANLSNRLKSCGAIEVSYDEDAWRIDEIEEPEPPLAVEEESTKKAVVVVGESTRDLLEREGRETRISLAARRVVMNVVAECVRKHVETWLHDKRQAAKATRDLLLKTSHADYRVNKVRTARPEISLLSHDFETSEDILDLNGEMKLPEKVTNFEANGDAATEDQADNSSPRVYEVEAENEDNCLAHYVDNTLRSLETERSLVRRLELVECGIDDNDMKRLASALRSSVVNTLELGKNRITSVGASMLAACAFTCLSLRDLHLNENDIGDVGVTALCTSFFGVEAKVPRESKQAARLKVLNLTSNPISATGAKGVAQGLTSPCCFLEILRLGGVCSTKSAFKAHGKAAHDRSDTVLGNRGVALLAASLLAPTSGRGNRPQARLTSLSLVQCGIGEEGSRAIAAALYCEPPLTHLDLTNNPLEGSGKGAFALNQIKMNEAVLERLANPPPLPEIKSKACTVKPDGGVAAIARALEATTTIRSIVKLDELGIQEFLTFFAHQNPAPKLERRRRLGSDSYVTREWLLTLADSHGVPMPARGDEAAPARVDLTQSNASPLRGTSTSALQEDSVWKDFVAKVDLLWPPSHLRDLVFSGQESALSDANSLLRSLPKSVPFDAPWIDLTRARLSLDVLLSNIYERDHRVDGTTNSVQKLSKATLNAGDQPSAALNVAEDRSGKSKRPEVEKLEAFIAALKAAAAKRWHLERWQALVAVPTGLKSIDEAQFEARTEQIRANAALVATDFISSSREDRARCTAARVAATARVSEAERREKDWRLEATAFTLANQPLVAEKLREHNPSLLRAIKPNGSVLATFYNTTMVRILIDSERRKNDALIHLKRTAADKRRRERQVRRELRAMSKLSPRSRFECVTRRIDEVREGGYPKTEEGITLLRKLRNYKAQAKVALKKERKEHKRAFSSGQNGAPRILPSRDNESS